MKRLLGLVAISTALILGCTDFKDGNYVVESKDHQPRRIISIKPIVIDTEDWIVSLRNVETGGKVSVNDRGLFESVQIGDRLTCIKKSCVRRE